MRYEHELSALLTAYLTSMGYCVHGEVSVFHRTLTFDHVAHLGPCDCPEYVLTFQLKLGFTQDLIRQMMRDDLGHYGDAHYMVTPKKRGYTRDLYAAKLDHSWYIKPGWIVIGEEADLIVDATVMNPHYALRNKYRLLLTEANRGMIGGVKGEVYDTHWKLACRYHRECSQHNPLYLQNTQSMKQVIANAPSALKCYKNLAATLKKVAKCK
jgi:hypothetical protein